MQLFFIRLTRIVPLIVAVIVLVIIVFLYIDMTKGRTRAKEMCIRIFWWFCGIASAITLLITLYAWIDGSWLMVELSGSCLVFFLVCWGIDFFCGLLFKRKNPEFTFIARGERARVRKRFHK